VGIAIHFLDIPKNRSGKQKMTRTVLVEIFEIPTFGNHFLLRDKDAKIL